jgi:putrescine transport system substrate-binding protein
MRGRRSADRGGCAALLALTAAALVACSSGKPAAVPVRQAPASEERVLNVLNWSDYIAPDTLEKFQQETGIKVNYDVFDSNEVLETKLLTGRTGYDVVVPTDYFLERQARQGILLPLDRQQLPNYANLDPAVLQQLAGADPGNRYGVPYLSTVVGIGYNVDKLRKALGGAPVDSWAILFDPAYAAKLKDCGLVLLDSQSDLFVSARIYLGLGTESESQQDLAAVEALLLKIRPYVRYFHSSQYINDLANGEICAAIAWSGDVLQARDRAREAGKGVALGFAVPKEGAARSFDMLAIPADAPHARNAHRFINFLLRPDIAADITRFRKYPSANIPAVQLLPPELRVDAILFPPADVVARLRPHRAESLTYTRYANRAWTRIRTGR